MVVGVALAAGSVNCGVAAFLALGLVPFVRAADDPALAQQVQRLRVGRYYLDGKRYAEAEAVFRKASAAETDNAVVLEGLAEALGAQGKQTEARPVNVRLSALGKVKQGEALLKAGSAAEAETTFRQA